MTSEPVLTGYAAKFGELSEDLGKFREKIKPGAFARSLRSGKDVKLLWGHDEMYVMASTAANTLRLKETAAGLAVEAWPGSTRQWVKDVVETVKRGEQTRMSFAFKVLRESWETRGPMPIRTLEDVDLVEVSLVTWPAYTGTSMAASADERKLRKEFETAVNDYLSVGRMDRATAEMMAAAKLGLSFVPAEWRKGQPAGKDAIRRAMARDAVEVSLAEGPPGHVVVPRAAGPAAKGADRVAAAARRRRLQLMELVKV